VKPNTPAMIETIKKNNANLSILSLRRSFSPQARSRTHPYQTTLASQDPAHVQPIVLRP
jgi:hypothetical protein